MFHRACSVTLAVCAALLTGCGGGARSSVPAGGSVAPVQSARGQATFRIAVPRQATTAKTRAPRYVSPATTQLLVSLEQGDAEVPGYPVTVALSPTAAGCTSTLATTYCQLTLALTPGDYTALLTAEDASGTPLSSAQGIAFTVTAETNNVIAIVLSGIPHALQIAAGARAMHESGAYAFTLYGSAAQPVIVTALDADGNTIVGPGSPTYSTSLVNGSGWSAATPASTSPNTIAITPPGSNGSTATFSVTATYSDATCALGGAVCSAQFTIKNDLQSLVVANLTGNAVDVYTPPYTGAPSTVSNVSGPYGLALDHTGNLFVLNDNNNSVTEYAPPYTGAPTATITVGVAAPRGLTLDGYGDLFVANAYDGENVYGNTVTEIVPPYTASPAETMSVSQLENQALQTVVLDASGNLFVASQSSVMEFPPPYTSGPTLISNGVNGPVALLLDGAGDLFVANYGNNTTEEFAPPYTGAPTTTITIAHGMNNPYALALDGAGNLFVGNVSGGTGGTVTEYAPPYTATPTTTISSGVNGPYALTLDGAGNLFVGNAGGHTVTEYAPPYTAAPTTTITGVGDPIALLLTP